MIRFLLIGLFVLATSCKNIEFIYDDKKNLLNPLYGKTIVETSGLDMPFIRSYIPMFFGENKTEDYVLSININENKIKRSVETNQATSNLEYELRFVYLLKSNDKKCVVYKKEISSSFTIIPKSSGYNYGTDSSLENKYELAVTDSLNEYVSFLSNVDLDNCL